MPEEEEIDPKTLAVFKKKGYKLEKPLGAGAYGLVYKGQIVESQTLIACKVMNLDKVDPLFKNKFLVREMAAMIEAVHPNVVRVYDIIKANHRLYIFMEFCGGGDIMGYLKKHGPIPVPKTNYWFKQASEGLAYLHDDLHISHRDIKVDNILLDEQTPANAKLSDFGFAKKSWDDNDEIIMSETFCGTLPYQCPQIIRKKKYDPFKADVWAMGIVLFGMLNDKFPFHYDKGKEQMYKEMKNPEHVGQRYVKKQCKHVRHLIKKMLELDENDRFSMKDVVKHKWIREKAKCCEE